MQMMTMRNSCLKLCNFNRKSEIKLQIIKSFSTAEMRQISNESAGKSVKETVEVPVNSNSNSNSSPVTTCTLLDHPVIKKLQTKTLETGSKLSSFARGPLRSNLLISIEFLKLISVEQRLVPALSTWPQAKDSYISTFNAIKGTWDEGRVNWKNFREMAKEATWGHVGRVLRVSAEMASFYYIGELIGMLISLPF